MGSDGSGDEKPSMAAALGAAATKRPWLAAFVGAYLVAFTIAGLSVRAELTIPYLVVVATLLLVVVRLDLRFDLGTSLLWALAVWGLVHMAGGIIPLDGDRVLYNARFGPDLFRYDRFVHAFGFGSATLACGKVLRHWLPGGRFDLTPAGIVVLAGMGVGGINEIAEFIATLVLEDTNVGGYDNTGWDLVFDLLGATIAGLWLMRSTRASGSDKGAAGAQ